MLPRLSDRPSLAYVAAGEGSIKQRVREPIHERQFISISRKSRVVFKADRPLAIYLFDMIGAEEGEPTRPTE